VSTKAPCGPCNNAGGAEGGGDHARRVPLGVGASRAVLDASSEGLGGCPTADLRRIRSSMSRELQVAARVTPERTGGRRADEQLCKCDSAAAPGEGHE
jgi:hypothetical protein